MSARRGGKEVRKKKCVCKFFVTGGIRFNFERDEKSGRVTRVAIQKPLPRRTAVSPKFVERMNASMPGFASWEGDRLVLRSTTADYGYRKVGVCGCGYIMIESEETRGVV